jgi:hypothetical protein
MKALVTALVIGTLAACARTGVGPEPEPEPTVEDPGPVDESPKPPDLAATTGVTLEPAGALSVSGVNRLLVDVSVVGAPGPRELALEFITPSGDVYRRSARPLPGSAFDTQTEQFELLVSGTNIDLGSMSGSWTARVLLDGSPLTTRTFELAP